MNSGGIAMDSHSIRFDLTIAAMNAGLTTR